MNTTETLAIKWHMRSDHARDGAKFGSPTCNCLKTAERIIPMLAEAWDEGGEAVRLDMKRVMACEAPNPPANPYR